MSRSLGARSLTTWPPMEILPPLISSRPASIRSSVDLPQPDGPTSTMNSPSPMSKLTPLITFVLPKAFSMFWNDTVAICDTPLVYPGAVGAVAPVERSETRELVPASDPSALDRACRQPADHVALERIIDRRRRQRVDESRRHQQLPRRIVGREEVAERDAQRDVGVLRQQQERVQVLVPRKQQR